MCSSRVKPQKQKPSLKQVPQWDITAGYSRYELGLKKIRDKKVRYANNKTELKLVYGIVRIEIKGRAGNFDVLAEERGSQSFIGKVVLEVLDLVVDPRTRTLILNPS